MVEPEILVVDEVLSVGDARFKQKSQEKIMSLFNKGVTVLFVSHSVEDVKAICNKAIWLEKGKMVMQGEVNDVCDRYMESLGMNG